MRVLAAALIIFLVSAAPIAAAEEDLLPPPQWPGGDDVHATLAATPVGTVWLGDISVAFEETTLPALLDAAGVGRILHWWDAGASEYWLCYTLPSGQGRLWIVSHGEMGGPDHAVGSIRAQASDATVTPTAACPGLPAHFLPIVTHNGLWLGSDARRLETLYGASSESLAGWRSYCYVGKLAEDTRGIWDRVTCLDAQIRQGRIVALFLSQVTSN